MIVEYLIVAGAALTALVLGGQAVRVITYRRVQRANQAFEEQQALELAAAKFQQEQAQREHRQAVRDKFEADVAELDRKIARLQRPILTSAWLAAIDAALVACTGEEPSKRVREQRHELLGARLRVVDWALTGEDDQMTRDLLYRLSATNLAQLPVEAVDKAVAAAADLLAQRDELLDKIQKL